MTSRTASDHTEIVSGIMASIRRGEFVPFLGAGASLCGRPPGIAPSRGRYLPNGSELASSLAEEFGYPPDEDKDLARVAEYVAIMQGTAPLYRELRAIFDADYPLTPLHRFLARVPALLRAKNYPTQVCNQLIVTTNYDDIMERAFDEVGEVYDVVTYEAKENSSHQGKFYHWRHGESEPIPILSANDYDAVSTEDRSVILKLHGLVNRLSDEHDSFVIREEDYINYLARATVSELVPTTLLAKLNESNMLFLGYGLQDWNVRVILYWIWGWEPLRYNSWAVQLEPKLIDERLWGLHKVHIIRTSLEEFVSVIDDSVESISVNM